MSAELPRQLIVDTESKALHITPSLDAAIPSLPEAFSAHNDRFNHDPLAYLTEMHESVLEVSVGNEGKKVAASVLYDGDSRRDEMLVVFAPFSDCEPKSQPDTLLKYLEIDKPSGKQKAEAAPNSWSQVTKSAVLKDVLTSLGKNISVVTVFSPLDPKVYSREERAQIVKGDFTPASNVLARVISAAEGRTWRPGNGKVQATKKVHLTGGSLGAHNAIMSAVSNPRPGIEIASVTAQELITGQKNLVQLGDRFVVHGTKGSETTVRTLFSEGRIEEPDVRQQITRHGNEFWGMNRRMLQGATTMPFMRGLTHEGPVIEAMQDILAHGARLLVANASQSSMSHTTPSKVPGHPETTIVLRGDKGQKLAHIANEFVALSTTVTALNVTR